MADANCDIAHEVAFDQSYRITQLYTFLASFGAICPLLHLIFFKIQRTTFNSNVKFLYMLYFSQILISVINNTVVFAHHVVLPFLAVSYCDVMVDPFKLRIFQYLGVFGISAPMLTILGISAERLLALIFARCYETSRLHIGLAIGVIAMVADVAIVFLLFRDEKFDKPTMSYFMIPATSGKGMNLLCYTLLGVNVLNMLFSYILVKLNEMLKEKWRSDLSTRYQIEENIITTKFSTCIAILHVFFFMLYLVFTLFLRIFGPDFLTSAADLLAMRGMYITIPTYNLIIGVLSCAVLQKLQKRKVDQVAAEVAINYGFEGTQMHAAAILDAWRQTEEGKQSGCRIKF